VNQNSEFSVLQLTEVDDAGEIKNLRGVLEATLVHSQRSIETSHTLFFMGMFNHRKATNLSDSAAFLF
jgi:hypothetical protein